MNNFLSSISDIGTKFRSVMRALVHKPGYALVEAAVLWIAGCVIGLPLAYLLSAELAGHLPALGALAPWIAAAVAIALGITALVAALAPALRVSRTDLAHNLKQ